MAIRVAAINTYRMYIEPGSAPAEPEPARRQSERRLASGDRRQPGAERRKASSDRRRRDENAAERVTAELRKSFLFDHLPPEEGSAENNAGEIPGISGETFDARL
jgi:hypothetical protein